MCERLHERFDERLGEKLSERLSEMFMVVPGLRSIQCESLRERLV